MFDIRRPHFTMMIIGDFETQRSFYSKLLTQVHSSVGVNNLNYYLVTSEPQEKHEANVVRLLFQAFRQKTSEIAKTAAPLILPGTPKIQIRTMPLTFPQFIEHSPSCTQCVFQLALVVVVSIPNNTNSSSITKHVQVINEWMNLFLQRFIRETPLLFSRGLYHARTDAPLLLTQFSCHSRKRAVSQVRSAH